MDSAKIQTIMDWPEPRKVKDIQSFLGFANFYWQFISDYSKIVVLLTCLTCKGAIVLINTTEVYWRGAGLSERSEMNESGDGIKEWVKGWNKRETRLKLCQSPGGMEEMLKG